MLRKNPLSVAVATVISSLVGVQAFAESAVEEVVVTGIKGSLLRALDVKRDATGVVDAISAEDIGKMPDSNLAESLQRITGVSINRVNGEGSEVTVRGFGGSFNLVTVNGRQMPSANVTSITGNPLDQGSSGVSRSFDFSNVASEGVSGIQVYKTGRAAVPTGGVGATINIDTIKPLDAGGTKATVGIKAVEDTGGDDTTAEVSGLYSWANDEGTFGVSIFGSFQERDSGSRHMSVEEYNLQTWVTGGDDDSLTAWGMQDAVVTNTPTDGQLAAIPTNIGLGVNADERERTNGQLTLQFAPNDEMTITADAMYAENVQSSVALIDGLWLQRSFTAVEFDGNPVVAMPVKMEEEIGGGGDFFFQNLTLGVKDTMESFGVNFDWQLRDDLNLTFDAATSTAESGPDAPFGKNSVRFNTAGGVADWRAYDFTLAIPQAVAVIDDGTTTAAAPNGIFDLPDVGSQVTQDYFSEQTTDVNQFSAIGTWEFKEDVTVAFGASYLGTEMEQRRTQGQLTLGGWNVGSPGDIPEGLVTQTCTACEFDEGITGGVPAAANAPTGGGEVVALGTRSFGGDSVALSNALASTYSYTPGDLPLVASANNLVEEDIYAAFVQVDLDGELAGMSTHLTLGLRYEETETTSTTSQQVPTNVRWLSDNDFEVSLSSDAINLSGDGSYNNFLPSLDFSINLSDDLKARASFSQTLARPEYDKLFASTSFTAPARPVFLGGTASGSQGNVRLDPLESNNVDLSVEWYYGDANLLSLGYYRKNVANFVGNAQNSETLFGLRDATSGQAGTLSGTAVDELNTLGLPVTERNFFTMAAVLDNPSDFPNGADDFEEGQDFASDVFGAYDIDPVATDPLFVAQVTRPVNNQTATIYGWEFVSQHFFGETGLGYQFNYTTVEGDIEFDSGGDPSVDQFALEGLSDSANFVFIYEKHGISARLLYNWRDTFLNQVQRSASGAERNPEFIDEYEQWDLNISYEINDNFSVSFDAINLGEEEAVHYGRTKNQVFFIQELDTRYMLGVRYTM